VIEHQGRLLFFYATTQLYSAVTGISIGIGSTCIPFSLNSLIVPNAICLQQRVFTPEQYARWIMSRSSLIEL
jgi:hypothetical protein